jgi:hypothetical protein
MAKGTSVGDGRISRQIGDWSFAAVDLYPFIGGVRATFGESTVASAHIQD